MKKTAALLSVFLIVLISGAIFTQTIIAAEEGSDRSFFDWLVGVISYFVDDHDRAPGAHGLSFDGEGSVGIGTSDPGGKLHVAGGDVLLEGGGYNFVPPGGDSADLAFYRGGTGFAVLRRYAPDYTILQLWAPPSWAGSNEATLAIVRGDEPNVEYFDLYNNGYEGETQYGVRMQKRGTGAYRDFVFDYSDGAVKSEVMRLKPSGNVGIGVAEPTERLEVAGNVKADAFVTSALVFQEAGENPLRLSLVGGGLYLKDLRTGKASRVFLEEDVAALREEITREVMAEVRGMLLAAAAD